MTRERILIVEDEWLVAESLRRVLERNDFEVTGIAADATSAIQEVERRPPDLALLDMRLRAGSGTDVAAALGARKIPFVYVTAHSDERTIEQAGSTRPAGFVVKPFTELQVLAAVRIALTSAAASADDPFRGAVERIMNVLVEVGVAPLGAGRVGGMRQLPELSLLSAREWEVLRGLVSHQRVPTIARRLHISQSTVRNHLKSIFAKIGVHSQEELLEKLMTDVGDLDPA